MEENEKINKCLNYAAMSPGNISVLQCTSAPVELIPSLQYLLLLSRRRSYVIGIYVCHPFTSEREIG